MAERLKARPELLNRQRETVEHPFGTIKQWIEDKLKSHPHSQRPSTRPRFHIVARQCGWKLVIQIVARDHMV
jgi:hypothetical protein